jgi:hypothetical protein
MRAFKNITNVVSSWDHKQIKSLKNITSPLVGCVPAIYTAFAFDHHLN